MPSLTTLQIKFHFFKMRLIRKYRKWTTDLPEDMKVGEQDYIDFNTAIVKWILITIGILILIKVLL